MKNDSKENQNYITIDNDIRNGNLKNCYLLYGDEIYLKLQYKQKLLKAFGALDDDSAMNMATFSGKDINIDELCSLAGTMPFFADYRTILVSDSGFFKSSQDRLCDFIKEELPDTTRILFVEDEVDRRNRLFKLIKEKGSEVEMTHQSEEMLRKWILKIIKTEGFSVEPATVALFMQKTGNDMSNIRTELEKVICYCQGKNVIEAADIEEIVTVQLQDRVFAMIEAMNMKNQVRALHLYYELIALKVPAYKIFSLITNNFLQMYTAKELKTKGYDKSGIASKLGFAPNAIWRVDKLLTPASSYSLESLKQAFIECGEYDEKIKSGLISDRIAVEMLIVKYSTKN